MLIFETFILFLADFQSAMIILSCLFGVIRLFPSKIIFKFTFIIT